METLLDNLLQKNKFIESNIYYSPTKNKILKSIFKNCSKKGIGRGIPDRIYFDEANKLLIIIECKYDDINKAIKDLKIYKEKLINKTYNIYYVAFVENNYEIYNSEFNIINKPLLLDTFIHNKPTNYNITDMDKDIHKIHNYIRDYTKISNEDKSFFIACILISLKKNSFYTIIENYNTKEYIYDLIKQNLMDYEIDTSIFEFLRNDENNTHLYNIIKMVLNIYKKNPELDLLNKFYSEFVKYSNTDGKSLGIVLTPYNIITLMIKLLDIKDTDIFLDLCTGTGSFALEALKYNPKMIIAVEYQTKLHSLLKCNMVLRNIDLNKNEIIKGNCFDYEYKANKSAINPPYGMKDKKELDFVIKQLESVEEGGLVCAIIPTTCLNNNKFLNLKKHIMDVANIKIIINLSKIIFYPNANINTSIILIEKTTYKTDTLIVNYEMDGLYIKKHIGICKTEEYTKAYDELINICKNNIETDKSILIRIKYNEDWNFHNYNNIINFEISKKEFLNKINKFNYIQKELEIIKIEDTTIKFGNIKKFYLNELFDIQTVKRITLNEAKENKGHIPYISASELNYGITAYTSFKTHNGPCLTLSNSGSVCKCFYHKGTICGTDSIYILYVKKEYAYLLEDEIMIFISCLIEKNSIKYNFGRACRLNKLIADFIELPIINNKIDIQLIKTNYL